MGVKGFQDYWVAGSKFLFKRDAIGAAEQPWLDLGTIKTANPTVTPEKIELEDSWGGTKKLVDEALTKITEEYDLETNNLNLDNLAIAFLGDSPASFSQSVAHKRVTTKIFAGRIARVQDSDTEKTPLNMLGAVAGLISALPTAGVLSTDTVNDIVAATKLIKIGSSDLTSHFTAGVKFVVEGTGLANVKNARTYTVVSSAFAGGVTEVTVAETPVADETGVTGSVIYKKTTDSGTVFGQDTDWEVDSLDLGVVRAITGGAISTDADRVLVFSTAAISGKRTFNPQAGGSSIQGLGEIYYSRGNHEQMTVRRVRCSLTPSGAAISADDFSSLTIKLTVLSDVNAAQPAGTMTSFKGTLPSSS